MAEQSNNKDKPEKPKVDPVKRTILDSKKYAFAKAHWGPQILRAYQENESGIDLNDFKRAGLPDVTDALGRLLYDRTDDYTEAKWDAAHFFKNFALLLDPTFKRKAGKECKFLDWVCRNWVKTPIKAEDMYKIRERLNHFEQISTRLKEDGHKNRIDDIASFAELEDIMRKYEAEKMRKIAERAERRMSPEDKARLAKESAILYDGPEGKVVMPHTQWAAQYWGNQTKWCISAKDEEENYFAGYDKHWAVIIYIPKVTELDLEGFPKYSSFKAAAVGGGVYNEWDENKAIMPECLRRLVRVAGNEDYLNAFGSREFILETKSKIGPKPHIGLDTPYFDFYHENGKNVPEDSVPKDYWQDREFFKLYHSHKAARDNFPPEFYTDFELAREIIENFIRCNVSPEYLHEIDETVQDGEYLARLSILKDVYNFSLLPSRYKENKQLRALCKDQLLRQADLRQNSTIPVRIPEVFKNDVGFAKEIINIAPWSIRCFSGKLQSRLDLILIARAITDLEASHPLDYFNMDESLKGDLETLKNSTEIFKGAANDALPNVGYFNLNLYSLAQEIIKNGHGLSDKLVPTELLNNIDGYVLPAIKIAIEHGNEKYLVRHLRKTPALRGDAAAITKVEGALTKLEGMKKPLTAKPQRSCPNMR